MLGQFIIRMAQVLVLSAALISGVLGIHELHEYEQLQQGINK